MPQTYPSDPAVADIPAYWFSIMEMAKESGDFELAARAKRELERLGVHITYRRPRPPKEARQHAS